MKIHQFIDRYFWIFLLSGLLLGLSYPAPEFLMDLLKPLIMLMMFLVFLKSDLVHVLGEIKNYKRILYLVSTYMIFIPIIFFLVFNQFDEKIAIGILLLTSMPAAVASPAISDMVNGNTALSLSITIVTSIAAPFTIPIIFGFLNFHKLSINPWQIFFDLSIMVFIPIVVSQLFRRYLPGIVARKKHYVTPINICILSLMVYIVIGSQHKVLLNMSLDILVNLLILYTIFIVLHIVGYMLGAKQKKQNKISICIGMAYMNNGLAIVLAAQYFDPYILVLMVLSELPWNTLLVPFRKILAYT